MYSEFNVHSPYASAARQYVSHYSRSPRAVPRSCDIRATRAHRYIKAFNNGREFNDRTDVTSRKNFQFRGTIIWTRKYSPASSGYFNNYARPPFRDIRIPEFIARFDLPDLSAECLIRKNYSNKKRRHAQ
ncbi:hypothetical protein PUN28_007222 [Cardiocondyla obscurior]|uniref:Uncharacterized protein n=1 Tax=Cardiocondyla obscurior TaxID=286306 RepID=A0AAW2G7B5_9HYME